MEIELAKHRKKFLMIAIMLSMIGVLLPVFSKTPGFNVTLYFLAATFICTDLIDITIRVFFSRTRSNSDIFPMFRASHVHRSQFEPFAIIMSVHNMKSDADILVQRLAQYKTRTWIIDDSSDDDTALYLKFMGWNCLASDINRKKPGALKALLESMPPEIKTVVILDPDSSPLNLSNLHLTDLELAISRFQSSKAAACCPQIRIREHGAFSSLQMLECEMAFALGRKGITPYCIASGASIYDRVALTEALQQHSLIVYAEDLENSLILLNKDQNIYYDDKLIIETDSKPDISSWFSQRVGWAFGLVRVYSSRYHEVLKVGRMSPWNFYNFVIYLGLMTILLLPLKVVGIAIMTASLANGIDTLFALDLIPDNAITDPKYFSTTYAFFTLLTACIVVYLKPPAKLRSLIVSILFFYFYSAVHAIAMSLGYINWLSVHFWGRRFYRDHYMSEILVSIINADRKQ